MWALCQRVPCYGSAADPAMTCGCCVASAGHRGPGTIPCLSSCLKGDATATVPGLLPAARLASCAKMSRAMVATQLCGGLRREKLPPLCLSVYGTAGYKWPCAGMAITAGHGQAWGSLLAMLRWQRPCSCPVLEWPRPCCLLTLWKRRTACVFDFLLQYAIIEALLTSLIGSAACLLSEPAGDWLCQAWRRLLTEIHFHGWLLPSPPKPKPCKTNDLLNGIKFWYCHVIRI